jgi:hypothetical protein
LNERYGKNINNSVNSKSGLGHFITTTQQRMRLNNKIALITGSARGIGQATAELFQKEGVIVLISDIRDTEGHRQQNQLG